MTATTTGTQRVPTPAQLAAEPARWQELGIVRARSLRYPEAARAAAAADLAARYPVGSLFVLIDRRHRGLRDVYARPPIAAQVDLSHESMIAAAVLGQTHYDRAGRVGLDVSGYEFNLAELVRDLGRAAHGDPDAYRCQLIA